MTEKIKHRYEQEASQEQDNFDPEISESLEKARVENSEAKHIEKLDADKLAVEVEKHAKRSEEINQPESLEASDSHEFAAYSQQKGQTYNRTLKRVQQHLNASERLMSKAMHHKTVEKVSEGVGKTAARPSGILGGGIMALIGSFALLYVSKKYGFEYNFFVFFLLLAGGFLLGLLLELLIYTMRKAKS